MRIFLYFFSLLLFAGCSSSKQIEKRYTPDDKTVFDLINRLKKNATDIEAARLLPEAYRQAANLRKNINKSTFENMNEGDRWMEIAKQLQVAQQMYVEIKSNDAALKAVPNPWDPTLKIQEAKQNAAEEYYNQAQAYLSDNTQASAKKAYDLFIKANQAYPNYRDVKRMIEESKLLATIKVLVNPVNYDNYGWNYWGFSNDYLLYKIIHDLNNSSYNNVKFYAETDLRILNIQPDKIVNLNFTNLFIGQVYNDTYTINRSKEVQIGETKDIPPKPVYQTVTATVYVTRKLLQSNASLDCRIYDAATNRNIFFDRFPDTYTWKAESASYKGDSRALEQSDWNLINNSGNITIPSRKELALRLIDNCYNSLLSRIRSGVKFSY